MSDRDTLLTQIRQAIAEDPETDAIILRPDLKALLNLDWVDNVQILGDEGYGMTVSGTIH